MLLAVDVGNTQTHVGAFAGAELIGDWRLATRGDSTADELALAIAGSLDFRDLDRGSVEGLILSTVVPRLAPEYERLCSHHIEVPFLPVGPAARTGMPILIDNPHELGSDRLVNAVASYDRVGGRCLSVDFGTSINVDAVSADGEYLGGAIGPGLAPSLSALIERAARITRMDLEEPQEAIGRSTRAAINSGFIFGFAGLIDGIVRRIEDELPNPRLLATGGYASAVVPFTETIDEVDDLLTLKGLRLIHERSS